MTNQSQEAVKQSAATGVLANSDVAESDPANRQLHHRGNVLIIGPEDLAHLARTNCPLWPIA